jgi:hypothetical protein
MSEIKFVKALGDAIEHAAAARIASRRDRIRRRIVIGGLGLAIAATGVAAASGVFSTPEQLASTGVACYDQPSLDGGASVLSPGAQSPVEACRRVMRSDRSLVACRAPEHVAVLPGGPRLCERLGLEPLPAEYASARARVLELERALATVEASADCVPVRVFAARAQRVLDRLGWTGWRVDVREDLGRGPCGSALAMNGDGSRSIEGALSQEAHHLIVTPGPRRSTLDLLYGGPGVRVMDATGARCYSVAGLEQLVRDRLPVGDRALTFTVGSRPAETEIMGPRGDRLDEGCAVIVGFSPTDDDRGIEVEIWD